MFRRLFWKEWRENLWKLIFCGAVSLAFVAFLFRIRLFPDAASSVVISFIQMLVVPVVYALDIFSGEMSNRTIHLLFKFPVPRWKIFFSKYLVCILGMSLIFLATGWLMEAMTQGRETESGYLFKQGLLLRNSLLFGLVSLMLFSWFCPFAAQSRSEAGSLVAMFGVMIGWGIILSWSTVCEVLWAVHFVPYSAISGLFGNETLQFDRFIFSQIAALILVITVACYRFVKVRRYL